MDVVHEYELELETDEELDVEAEFSARMAYLDYTTLRNKPSINGAPLIGDLSSEDLGLDQTYMHRQTSASNTWTIEHGLGKHPSVTVVDSAGSVVMGEVQYISDNTIVISFRGTFSGTAYLN